MPFDWDDLRIFLSISEQGNLSSAARSLKVSQPTVGRRLKALEEHLGTRLFDRLPDGLDLTVHGEQLLPLAQTMAQTAHAVSRQQASFEEEVRGTVRISMYELVAQFFIQYLPELQNLCPEIEIEISIAHAAANLSRREADLLVRECLPDAPDIIGFKLGHYHYAVYGSDQYIQENPVALSEQQRFDQCDWVGFDDEHVYFTGQPWLREQLGQRLPSIRANNGVVLLQAIKQGSGLGVLPCFVGDREPDLKKIMTVPDDGASLFLLVHKEVRKSPAIRVMIDAVRELFKTNYDTLHGEKHH